MVAAVLAAAALASGCGGDDEGSATGAARPARTATQATTASPRDTSVKPVVEKPSGSPPRRLVVEDVVRGKGRPARPGDTVTMQYVGVAFSTGEQFDASWDRGQPLTFQLGSGQVIRGWDRGIAGMREGGRRKLVIPPELAYGSQGQGPVGPNETLIFVVDLVAIR
jgi:peptidylprolyl isomerase